MSASGLESVDTTVHKTHQWLADIMHALGQEDRRFAFSALRAVLHAVRDRLGVEDAAHLGAQLPMLLRGLYYEGWHPAGKPLRIRHIEAFLERIEQELTPRPAANAEDVARAVFRTMERHLSPGEIDKLRRVLPRALQSLWELPVEPRSMT